MLTSALRQNDHRLRRLRARPVIRQPMLARGIRLRAQDASSFEESFGSEVAVWKSEVIGLGELNRPDPSHLQSNPRQGFILAIH